MNIDFSSLPEPDKIQITERWYKNGTVQLLDSKGNVLFESHLHKARPIFVVEHIEEI